MGFGTAFPGKVGPFNVEIQSLSAGDSIDASIDDATPQSMELVVSPQSVVDLANFDGGSAEYKWHSENDPVMGGQSDSSWSVADGYGIYKGICRIVPKLKAPGFTIAMTDNPLLVTFPDVSKLDGLLLGIRNVGGNITSFKFAFCDSHINFYRCQFGTFKADFTLKPSSDFQEVFLPWSSFSDKWDPATGKHTAEEAPTSDSLKSLTQLQLWTEGVLGDFEVHLKYVKGATKPRVQSKLDLLV